jgi:hypothetical protein
MSRKRTPETSLKNACKDWLTYHHIWTFPCTAGLGSYPGVPDRIGLYEGKALALEFKSKRGVLTPSQVIFKKDWESRGGIHITCRSIEDLAEGFGIKTLLS